jgi:rare lipoprotein A
MFAMTAAHKCIPIPSYVRVTNQANGLSVVVRVNDRGPFHGSRIIDLSYAAAKKLGYDKLGVAEVRVEVITPAGQGVSGPVRAPSVPMAVSQEAYALPKNTYLQAGAFSSKAAAEALRARISGFLQEPVRVSRRGKLFKVQIGPVASSQSMLNVRRILGEKNLPGLHVVYD